MKSLIGLSACALLALFLSGCRTYTTPASSIANLTPVPTANVDPQPTQDLPSLWGRYSYHASHSLDLLGDGIAYYAAGPLAVMRDAYAVSGDEIVFAGSECDRATGTYRWTLEQGFLNLSTVSDPCPTREGMLGNVLRRLRQQYPYAAVQWMKPLNGAVADHAAADSMGNLYVTDGGSGFYKYDANGSPMASWANALSATTGIAVDNQGDIFVANFDDATVHEFDAKGQPVRSWSVGGGTDGPSALAVDSQGNVFVTLRRFHGHYVEKYSPDGHLLADWASAGNGNGEVGAGFKTGPEGVALDPSGNVYVADTVNGQLIKFDGNGKFLLNITGDGQQAMSRPRSVALDSKGNVYTISDGEIWKFDSSGAYLGQWFTPYEGSLVIGPQGSLYLVGQAIVKILLGAAG